MRPILYAAAAALLLGSGAPAAMAQDRYGSQAAYAPPPGVTPAPARVLTWAGKTTPQAPQPQYAPQGYGQPYAQPYPQPQGYPPQAYQGQTAPPAAWGSYPSMQGAYAPANYAPQPYASAPPTAQPQSQGQPMARPSVPEGPPVTVAPQAFYPPEVLYYPQAYQTLTGQPASFAPPAPPVQTQFQPAANASGAPPPQPAQRKPVPRAPAQPNPPPNLPTSIYDPPRPTAEAERPMQLAALDAPPAVSQPRGQGARTYSLHRPFGMTPDPVPAPAQGMDVTALLVPAEEADEDLAAGSGLGLRPLADVED